MQIGGPRDWVKALEGKRLYQDVEIAGGRLRYCTWGPNDISKPLVLLVHGYRGHLHWWDWIAPYLVDKYRPVGFDFSGMGDSDWRTDYDADTFLNDLLGVASHLKDGPMHAIAHSFGGTILLRACAEAPALFDKAVILDSRAVIPDVPGKFVRTLQTRRAPFPDQSSALERFRLIPDQPVENPHLLRHLATHSIREVPGGWAWKFDPSLPLAPVEMTNQDVLHRVLTPLTYMYGECSKVVTSHMAHRMVQELPHALGPYVIPNAHHHMMLDQPGQLLLMVRAALDSGIQNPTVSTVVEA